MILLVSVQGNIPEEHRVQDRECESFTTRAGILVKALSVRTHSPYSSQTNLYMLLHCALSESTVAKSFPPSKSIAQPGMRSTQNSITRGVPRSALPMISLHH
jgi:hypothetical protein